MVPKLTRALVVKRWAQLPHGSVYIFAGLAWGPTAVPRSWDRGRGLRDRSGRKDVVRAQKKPPRPDIVKIGPAPQPC